MTFNFEKIVMRDGRNYDFAGSLLSVKDHNGKVVKVDGKARRRATVTLGNRKARGLGAGLGACRSDRGGGKVACLEQFWREPVGVSVAIRVATI